MVRLRGFDPPPSFIDWFYRWIGAPRSTGFNIYVGDYPYGDGLSSGKRMRYTFPAKQGISGRLTTPSQSTQRAFFRAALDIWAEQPNYAAINPTFGQKARNWWYLQASGLAFFTINYFLHLEIPAQVSGQPSPWDSRYYLSTQRDRPGWILGVQTTPPLCAGTYRVTLKPAYATTYPTGGKYIAAVTVLRQDTTGNNHLIGPIGDFEPDENFDYADPALWEETQEGAWLAYTLLSLHTYRDVTLDSGERVAVRFRNHKVGMMPGPHGHIEAEVTKL